MLNTQDTLTKQLLLVRGVASVNEKAKGLADDAAS